MSCASASTSFVISIRFTESSSLAIFVILSNLSLPQVKSILLSELEPVTFPSAVMNLKSSPESSIESALISIELVFTQAFPERTVTSFLLPAVPVIESAEKVIVSEKIEKEMRVKTTVKTESFFITVHLLLPCSGHGCQLQSLLPDEGMCTFGKLRWLKTPGLLLQFHS